MSDEPLSILLAEDDEGHAYLIQKNLRRLGLTETIIHVTDGQAALDYVRREGAFANRPHGGPLLMVLDINMPRLDGVEVLTAVKGSAETAKIPVVMLTTTDDRREVERCYKLGCSVYITKPIDYENFVEAVTRLGRFLQVVQVPEEGGSQAA